jgi:UDP-glucose:glycoprotein glucosyltransferase
MAIWSLYCKFGTSKRQCLLIFAQLLQRGYPGQLPSIKKDIHNAIIPIDFSDPKNVHTAVETVQDFVKRKIPIRFGLVPLTPTDGAEKQAQVVYHILDTYGLGALMQYLEAVSVSLLFY